MVSPLSNNLSTFFIMATVSATGAFTFLVICLGVRLALAFLAYKLPSRWLPVMGAAALILAASWANIYLTGARPFAKEAGGLDTPMQIVWWNGLRPLHSGLYLAFALMAFHKSANAYKILLLDAAVGLLAWFYHYQL